MRGGNPHIVCSETKKNSTTNGRKFKACCQYKDESPICAEKLYIATYNPQANFTHEVETENIAKAKILDNHIKYIRNEILGIKNNGKLLNSNNVSKLKNKLIELGYNITPLIETRIKQEY